MCARLRIYASERVRGRERGEGEKEGGRERGGGRVGERERARARARAEREREEGGREEERERKGPESPCHFYNSPELKKTDLSLLVIFEIAREDVKATEADLQKHDTV